MAEVFAGRYRLLEPIAEGGTGTVWQVEELSRKQSTWTRNHVETRLNIWAAAQPHVVDAATMQELRTAALERASVAITPRLELPHHNELVNRRVLDLPAPSG